MSTKKKVEDRPFKKSAVADPNVENPTKAAPKKKPSLKTSVVDPEAVKKEAGVPVEVPLTHVSDIFVSREEEPEVFTVPPNAVFLVMNGKEKGTFDSTGQTVKQFAVARTLQAGIKTFSVYLDGRKADSTDAQTPLAQFHKIEIVTKDTRGTEDL